MAEKDKGKDKDKATPLPDGGGVFSEDEEEPIPDDVPPPDPTPKAKADPQKSSESKDKPTESEDNRPSSPLTASNMVFLKSGGKEPQTFELSRKQLMLANVFQYSLTHFADMKEFDIPQVRPEILKECVVYLRHHNGKHGEAIECPIKSSDVSKYIKNKWDCEFIKKFNEKELFRLLMAANYLDCASLLQLCCCAIASKIKGMKPSLQEQMLRDEQRAYEAMNQSHR